MEFPIMESVLATHHVPQQMTYIQYESNFYKMTMNRLPLASFWWKTQRNPLVLYMKLVQLLNYFASLLTKGTFVLMRSPTSTVLPTT